MDLHGETYDEVGFGRASLNRSEIGEMTTMAE